MSSDTDKTGPLTGVSVLEMKGIGPGPYAGMLLADMGATVTVVERSTKPAGIGLPAAHDINGRGKRSIALNVKQADGLATLLRLIDQTDLFFEGFRPGVAERLGFGPETCLARNPRLVYGRLTGWGQAGPLAHTAGHDLNYIALTGALAAIGEREKPTIPLNLIGDYAGGSLFLVMGMLAALIEAKSSGLGQVVDAAITDGSASLMSLFYSMNAMGAWTNRRQSNLLDGAAPFYDVYQTADQKFVAIAPIEPQFFAVLLEKLGIDPAPFENPHDPSCWPALREQLTRSVKTRTRDQWCELLQGTDACFAPVLDYREAPDHPHNKARESYYQAKGVSQPAPAPRFSRTDSGRGRPPVAEGADTDGVLRAAGFTPAQIARLRQSGAVG